MPTAAVAPTSNASAAKTLGARQRLLLEVGALTLRLWSATMRYRLSPVTRRLLVSVDRPALFCCWHNRLFLIADITRRFRPERPLHCLISASKDGAWLSAFFEKVGVRAVRGSSSKGGREAAAELMRLLRAGHDVGITPDGPRGPCYASKPGALVVARRGGVRVLALGIAYSSAWRLPSWDHFILPRPFSEVRLFVRELGEDELHAPDALARFDTTINAISPDVFADAGTPTVI